MASSIFSPPAFLVISNWLDSGILKVPTEKPISAKTPTNIAPRIKEDLNIEINKYIKYPSPPPRHRVY